MSKKKYCLFTILILLIAACSFGAFGASSDSANELVGLSVSEGSTEFYQWQPLKQDSFAVYGTYRDGTKKRIYDYNVYHYDSSKSGTQTVKINYQNITKDYRINLLPCGYKIAVGETEEFAARTQNVANVQWIGSSDALKIEKVSNAYVISGSYAGYIQYVTVSGTKEGVCELTCNNADTNQRISKSVISVCQTVENFSLDKEKLFLKVNDTVKLNASISPSSSNLRISWYSDDSAVVKVDSDGTVHAVKAGTATIHAELWDGIHKKTCKVHVVEPTSSIVSNVDRLIFSERNKPQKIDAYALPETATNREISFKVQDEGIVSVNESGEVYALGNGQTNIVITSADGFSEKKIPVSVSGLVMGIDVDKKTLDLTDIGQTVSLKVDIIPVNALNRELVWTSENPKIATVNSNGLVKAVAVGETDVTVTTKDGSLSQKIHVTVHPYITVTFYRPYDHTAGCYSLEVMQEKQVKWGEKITIGPINKECYRYVETYEDYNGTTFQRKLKDGSSFIATRSYYEFYIKYDPIKPNKLDLKTEQSSPWYFEKNEAWLSCYMTPYKVAETKIRLSVNNSSIACFENGKGVYDIDPNNYGTSDHSVPILLKLKGTGDCTVTATVIGSSVKGSINLRISKGMDGRYAIENSYTPVFKVKVTSPSEVRFSLTKYKNFDRYVVFRADSKGRVEERCDITADEMDSSDTVYLYDYNLKYGGTYTYYVRGYFQNGTCSKQVTANVKMNYVPTFKLESTGYKSIKMTIDRPQPHENNGHVEVFRSTDNKHWEWVGAAYQYTFHDTNLTNGKKYYYKIRMNYNGEITKYSAVKSCVPVVAAPKVSSAVNTSSGVQIKWKSVKGATSYVVYRLSKSGKWTSIGSTDKTYLTDKSVKSGATYTYAVRAKNKNGTSPYIGKMTVTYLSQAVISKLKTGSKKASVRWEKVDGASGYIVYMATSKNGKFVKIGSTSKLGLTKIGLTKGEVYYFQVKAFKKVGNNNIYGSYSAVKSIKVE